MLAPKEILKRIGLIKLSPIEFQKLLEKNSGKETSDLIFDELNNRADGNLNKSFYSLKNRSLSSSLIVSSAFDYDYYLNFLTAINQNTHWVGKTILDIGCDCGILSCALALMYPESRVVGIDRCNNAIANAKELANKLHLSNVSFRKGSIESIDVEIVDTIISSKVLHEIVNTDDITYDRADLFNYSNDIANRFEVLGNLLDNTISNGGYLISAERFSYYPDSFGYILALYNHSFIIDDNYKSVIVNNSNKTDCGKPEKYPLYAFHKMESIPESYSPFYSFAVICEQYGLDFHKAEYSDWEALIVFEIRKEKMLFGCNLFEGDTNIGDISLWSYSGDKTTIICKQVIRKQIYCAFVDASQMDSLISSFDANEIKKNYHVDKVEII